MQDLTGQTFKGYEFHQQLGKGGFGAVYRAFQPLVKRDVAIKVILPQFASQPEFIRRFEIEAELVARLEHPHIVPLFDYWREPAGAFLVLRFLRGGSLTASIRKGPLDLEWATRLLDQIAGALTVAHRNNVIHRDIKPDNILLDEDENAFLADFGIAKNVVQGDSEAPEAVIGSPAYMSPEQITARPVSPQTDIYGLGMVVYEMLTGSVPFGELDSSKLLIAHLRSEMPPMREIRHDLPEALDDVIRIATAKDPANRFPSARDFARAFRQAVATTTTGAAGFGGTVRPSGARSGQTTQITLTMDDLAEDGFNKRLIEVDGSATAHLTITEEFLLSETPTQDSQPLIRVTGTAPRVTISGDMLLEDDFDLDLNLGLVVNNPYKGLRPFSEADAADFFGRDVLIQRLLDRLRSPRDGTSSEEWQTVPDDAASSASLDLSRFLAVVGPSGSGKSSAVKAGLLPTLRRGGIDNSDKWFIVEMTPGSQPLANLEAALLSIAYQPLDNMGTRLQAGATGLVDVLQALFSGSDELLLLIDQFEEAFTQVADEKERTLFLDLIRTAVTAPHSRLRVIVTLRADFTDRPLQYVEFGEIMRQRMEFVLPLSAAELERAIVGPAERVGLQVQPELVAAMVSDVREEPGALPLLQYALTELFERRDGNTLVLSAYLESGGVLGALARRAEEVFVELPADLQAIARQVFLRLVTLGEGSEDTRRRARRSELTMLAEVETMNAVLDLFGKYRLLTFDVDSGTREPTIEVAHEALIREWKRLRDWLDSSRADIRLQRLLGAAAVEWEKARRERSFLLTGARLSQFENWVDTTDLILTPQERDYLRASLEERARQEQAERERQARELETQRQLAEQRRRAANRLRYFVAALSVFLLVAIGLTIFALTQRSEAREQRDEAEKQRTVAEEQEAGARHLALAVSALSQADQDRVLATGLALEAIKVDDTQPFAPPALGTIAYAPGAEHVFTGHTDAVFAVAVSPAGTQAASGGGDGAVILWDTASGEELRRLNGHAGTVNTVLFSPDGRFVLSGGKDQLLILWEATTGIEVRRFVGHEDRVWSAAFSPDGRTFISGAEDGLVILWDVESGAQIRRFESHTGGVNGVAFSPEGTTILSASSDRSLIQWDIETGEIIQEFFGHNDVVSSVAFSPDGTRAISGAYDNTLIEWDLTTGESTFTFQGHTDFVTSVSYSADGTMLVSTGLDKKVLVWDIAAGSIRHSLTGHRDFVNSAVFFPSGNTILSASTDSTLLRWNLNFGAALQAYRGHELSLNVVAVSPDGNTLLTGALDSTMILWDVAGGEALHTFTGHSEEITDIAFSPDGKFAASASWDDTLILWDMATQEEVRLFTGHTDDVWTVAFSPDGQTLLSGSSDQTAILWDVATGAMLHTLAGEPEWVRSVAFSPDGKTALTGYQNGLIIAWDVATGTETRRFSDIHTDIVAEMVFSTDGTRVFSGSYDRHAVLWDFAGGEVIQSLEGHSDWVDGVSLSTDAKLGLSASYDKSIIVWDLESGDPLRIYETHTDAVTSVVFSPLDNSFFSASLDAVALHLRYDTLPELVEWTRENRYVRDFTCEEREDFAIEPLCEEE